MGRPLNVLVYAGTGAGAESVRHALSTLRLILSPNYAVIPITETALLKEPWEPSCAAIVFPGGRDLGFARALNGDGNERIKTFVRNGGAYIGFCAGAYYASKQCEFEVGNPELEVIGSRELGFFPGTFRGGAFKGYAYDSERGAKAAVLEVGDAPWGGVGDGPWGGHVDFPNNFKCYYNGGGVFIDADKMEDQGVEVLAEYGNIVDVPLGDSESQVAAVYCQVEFGSAVLFGPHPEFSPSNMTSRLKDIDTMDPDQNVLRHPSIIAELKDDDKLRISFLKSCLSKLGLEVDSERKRLPTLSKMHLSSIHPSYREGVLQSLMTIAAQDGEKLLIQGEKDKFRLEKPMERSEVPLDLKTSEESDSTDGEESERASITSSRNNRTGRGGTPDHTADFDHITKRIVCYDAGWPDNSQTPFFNHSTFYTSLEKIRVEEKFADPKWNYFGIKGEWGNVFMYGNVLTSTNSLLDKNPILLSKLPTGFTLAATTQLAGRGRGNNVWVAPAGSLLMSTVINHPATHAISRPAVFIQYLAAIAVAQAVASYRAGCDKLPIKLKWPNDILARDPAHPDEEVYVKIGGILSTCSYQSGTYQIVLGIGLNVNNPRPTTSLDALMTLLSKNGPAPEPFRIEELMARIIVRLEALYGEFMADGFSDDMHAAYYHHWLHSGQLVTLDAQGVKGRIVGITSDWGMLKVDELEPSHDPENARSNGIRWALRSDENSFDFWQGLIKTRIP